MKGQLEIHSENILPIIKKWLYSDRDIFVRELVSNGCDAVEKFRKTQGEEEFAIHINISKENNTLEFIDNGIGMTQEEVKKYIAQIAFSGAEEFMKHYTSEKPTDQLIGHFGLGFYSAYLVAKKVEIETKSYQEAPGVFWSCDGSTEYDLEPFDKKERGTLVRLHLLEECKEYLDEPKLRAILKKYTSFLPVPIYLNGKQINEGEPLWMKNPKNCTKEEYLAFYRKLYPLKPDPLFWIHLNVDYPFYLQGILYFPKIDQDFDQKKHTVELYCNRVFVADNCQDILPRYLTALHGVIDSPDLPLNVSRSYLQHDKTVKQLAQHISKKVGDHLAQLKKEDEKSFFQALDDVGVFIKLGAMEDDKFYDRVKELLVFQTIEDQWLNVEAYKEQYGDCVYYTKSKTDPLLELYQDKRVLILNHPIDAYLINFLEGKMAPLKFQRVDGQVDDALVDTSREKTLLDSDGKTESAKISETFQRALEGVEVSAKSLKSETLPALVVLKEEERRMRDFFLNEGKANPFPVKPTLVVNTNHPLIQGIYAMTNASLKKELVQEVFDLSLLAQHEMNAESMSEYVKRSQNLLTKLIQTAS